jgi:hypothetical protein
MDENTELVPKEGFSLSGKELLIGTGIVTGVAAIGYGIKRIWFWGDDEEEEAPVCKAAPTASAAAPPEEEAVFEDIKGVDFQSFLDAQAKRDAETKERFDALSDTIEELRSDMKIDS